MCSIRSSWSWVWATVSRVIARIAYFLAHPDVGDCLWWSCQGFCCRTYFSQPVLRLQLSCCAYNTCIYDGDEVSHKPRTTRSFDDCESCLQNLERYFNIFPRRLLPLRKNNSFEVLRHVQRLHEGQPPHIYRYHPPMLYCWPLVITAIIDGALSCKTTLKRSDWLRMLISLVNPETPRNIYQI